MLIQFLVRAGSGRSGPIFMPGERAQFSDAIAQEFIERGVATAVEEPAPAPTVDRPEKDRMVRKGDVVRK